MTKKIKVTARDVTGFDPFFSAQKIRKSSLTFGGDFPTKTTQQNWRQGGKSTAEYFKQSSGESAPKLQIS